MDRGQNPAHPRVRRRCRVLQARDARQAHPLDSTFGDGEALGDVPTADCRLAHGAGHRCISST